MSRRGSQRALTFLPWPRCHDFVLRQVAALTVYMFCGWFTDRFVLVFVTLVLLLAFDFWAVKVRPAPACSMRRAVLDGGGPHRRTARPAPCCAPSRT